MDAEDNNNIASRMVGTLRTEPCRSSDLFRKVDVDERRGRDALASLIDNGRVVVETDWTLRVRADS